MKSESISRPVKRKDFDEKMSGRAKFVNDYLSPEHYHACVLRSERPHARIVSIDVPPIPDNVWVVRASDVPVKNRVLVDFPDQFILNDVEVQYVGEAILIVVAKTKANARRFMDKIAVEYEDLPTCFDVTASDVVLHDCRFTKGNPDQAFAGAHEVFEEVLTTGFQEHAYIEPQGMVATYRDGSMKIVGAMQCPFYIHNAIKLAFGLDDDHVQVIQATVGGGFGGKEEYPSVVGLQAALASYVSGKPVKLVLDRQEDIMSSTKRHAGHMKYRTALDEKGNILAMDVNITLDGGAYLGISTTVIERSLVHCLGPYVVDHVRAYGSVRKTNQVVTGAFRGFGDPQAIFAVDMHLTHLAKHVGRDPLEYRLSYLARQGDRTATDGVYRDPVFIREMADKVLEQSDYYAKRAAFAEDTGRYRRGIGLGLVGRGCGFAGFAERDFVKGVVRIRKHADDTVEALVSSTDLGQGIHTSFCKVIAETIGIPLSQVICRRPDTQRVPNSGPTNASRSMQIVGRILQRAALRLKDEWIPGKEQLIEEHYREEREAINPWNAETFNGDGFATYGWSATVCEVELDTVTSGVRLVKLWGVFDVGHIIDRNLVIGQMHGGLVQGYGYASMEKLEIENGVILQDRLNNYMIPTAFDIGGIHVDFINNPYEAGPFGAKGAAELPFCGVASSYVHAVESVTQRDYSSIPLTPEKIFESLQEEV